MCGAFELLLLSCGGARLIHFAAGIIERFAEGEAMFEADGGESGERFKIFGCEVFRGEG